MKRLFILLAMGIVCYSTNAQTFADEIKKDIVTVEGGKFKLLHNAIISYDEGEKEVTKKVKVYVEAPATGVISRDYFVYFSFDYIKGILQGTYGMTEYSSKNVDDIKKPDIDINVQMSKTGLLVKVTANGKVEQMTEQWSDYDNAY